MSEWQGVCRHSAHACARLGVGLECLAIGVSVAFISIVVCARSMRDAVQTPSKSNLKQKICRAVANTCCSCTLYY